MGKLLVIGIAAVALVSAAAGAAATPAITATSIHGAKLGLSAAAYKKLLGTSVRERGTYIDPSHPENYIRLDFEKAQAEVYFKAGVDRGIEITTWNRAYRTAAGVGPCSTLAQLKKAYGSQLKPSPDNTQNGVVYAWLVGRSMLFATNGGSTVLAVAVFAPGAHREPALGYASFVLLNEATCS